MLGYVFERFHRSPKYKGAASYMRLMRWDRPVGIWLTLWPCFWSIAIAAEKSVPLFTYFIFIIGSILMRSAGCVINDIWDRNIDKQVARTCTRPLATGELQLHDAFFTLFFLLISACLLLFLLPPLAQLLGISIIIPIFLYPLFKRFTYWAQLFLGIVFNWGALMGWVAVTGSLHIQPILIYLACVSWTLGYDTIYAHQDSDDDALLGLKSTALKFGLKTKPYLYFFYGITTLLLWIVSVISELGIVFHFSLILSIIFFFWQVSTLDIGNAENCARRFYSNQWYGLLIFLGILGGIWGK